MGDTKSNELFFKTLRRSKVPIEFLPTLGKGIRLHCDSGPMMLMMVHNYNRSLWSLFRMMHYNMLINLCLYDEDVVFFTEDNTYQLRQHPFTFPVLSLQSILPKLGVTVDNYMASLLERQPRETDADLQKKKEIIVRAIISADTWNTFESITGVFSGQWSHNLTHILAEYEDRLDDWLHEPNNEILAVRRKFRANDLFNELCVINTHPNTAPSSEQQQKILYACMQYHLNAIVDGEYVFPLFEFSLPNWNWNGITDSLLHFRSESEICLRRIGYFENPVQNFVESMVPDTTKEALEDAITNKTPPGILNLYVPRAWTRSLCYKKRSTLFPILRATYSCSPFEGSELIFMLKKLYGMQDESDIWKQFIESKRGVYAPDTAITFIDDSRPGHRDKRMKRRSRGTFDDSRMSSSSQLKQRT